MSETDEWDIPVAVQPDPTAYAYDLDTTLDAVVTLTARVPAEAASATSLGTERSGNGVLIHADGIVLTMGYLVMDANEVWLTTNKGRVVPGVVLGLDHATGFGLVRTLGALDVAPIALGQSEALRPGAAVVLAAGGGRARALAAQLVARQEFAGYWEYVLDDALFTAPAHPHWGGAALIGPDGKLAGIGSLQLPHQLDEDQTVTLNMVVPIDLLTPIFENLRREGRSSRPPRPWLGLYANVDDERVMIVGTAARSPARRAGLREGDIVLAVGGTAVVDLANFFRSVWATGQPGVDVQLTLDREGDIFDVSITSSHRDRTQRSAKLH